MPKNRTNIAPYAAPGVDWMYKEKAVIKHVCKFYKVSAAELRSRSRERRLNDPRQVAIFLLVTDNKLTLSAASAFFCRGHATAINAIKNIRNRCDTEKKINEDIYRIRGRIKKEIG